MVTTTMRMVNRVHAHTAHAWPAVALDLVLVVRTAGLHQRLVDAATSGYNTNGRTAVRLEHLLRSRRQLHTGDALVVVVAHNGGIVAGRAGKRAAVANLLLNVAHNGTLGHGADGKDVSDAQVGLLSAKDKLASVHALGGDEQGSLPLVRVRITELDLGEGSTTAGIVDDLADDTANVALALGKVQVAQLGSALAMVGVALEDTSLTLALSSNDATH